MRRVAVSALTLGVAWGLVASPLHAQSAGGRPAGTSLLQDFNRSVEDLTTRVSMSVVQVLVTGYGPIDGRAQNGETGLVIGPQHSVGSGAIIDPQGYIITNAHVVSGARRVQVVLRPDAEAGAAGGLAAEGGRTVDARVVGTATDIDLALLKVDLTGLRALPLANYDATRQGEIVFAFGSPEGLRNSVTMGVVSSVARQPDPDSPTIYIQTDAPINPGNSGGPLVNVDGELVGLNTFILSESGGSQGLGFAIPSAIVASAYPQLKKYGHLHRGLIGINLQAITPALAAGLGLSRASGVMVSDVMPDSPAESVGVGIKDVITSINGKPVDSVPTLSLALSVAAAGDTVDLGLLRGNTTASVKIPVVERTHLIDELSELSDPEANTVASLGIIGVDVSPSSAALLPGLRISSGVFVAARTQIAAGNQVPLLAGDVIHAVNAFPVRSLDGLRVLLDEAKGSSDLVLQIERDARLTFITCQLH